MKTFEKLYQSSSNITAFAQGYFNHLKSVLDKFDLHSLTQLEAEFEDARKNGNTIFVAGNGGSATTASTMPNDLGFDIFKRTVLKNPFRVLALTENNALITAIANDVGYDNAFISQLKIHYRNGDKLLAISASGNSENVVRAANWVNEQGGKVIGFVGFEGGKIKAISDVVIHAKTEAGEFGPVEDLHLIINHVLAHWFTEKYK